MQSDNLRGIVLLIVAMGFFAATDTCLKLASDAMPKGQVLFFLGIGGGAIFAALTLATRQAVFALDFFRPAMILRNAAEIVATFSFLTALAAVGLSLASAIIQATPLGVTFFAVILLGEKVGWRRWSAILVGLFGVLVILRPGLQGFEAGALWAVAAMLALSLRDVSTRLLPATTPSTRIAMYGMLMSAPTGLLHMALVDPWVPLTAAGMWPMAGGVVFGALGYYAMVQAMRVGEISVVAPFRYTRILFALTLGWLVFSEEPDLLTYLGCAITIGAGLYSFLREARLARRAARAQAAT